MNLSIPVQFAARGKQPVKKETPAPAAAKINPADAGAVESPHGLLNDVKQILADKNITTDIATVDVGSTPLHPSLQRPGHTHHRFIEIKAHSTNMPKIKEILSKTEGMHTLNPTAFVFVKGMLRAAVEMTNSDAVLG